jgi:hypothetical protein
VVSTCVVVSTGWINRTPEHMGNVPTSAHAIGSWDPHDESEMLPISGSSTDTDDEWVCKSMEEAMIALC